MRREQQQPPEVQAGPDDSTRAADMRVAPATRDGHGPSRPDGTEGARRADRTEGGEDSGRHHAPTRARRLLVGGALLAVVGAGAATWAVLGRRGAHAGTPAPATAREGAQGGMAGMPGMGGAPGTERMGGMSVDASGAVRLTADQIRTFGLTFGTAEERPLEAAVRTVGSVTADETRLAQVAPRVGGYVERLYVAATGQPVRRGQPLLDVYSPELVAAQEELLVARRLDRTLDESALPGVPAGSSNLLAAARRRLRLLDVSEGQIDDVLRTGRVRRALTLYSPASGVVTEKQVVQGQAIQPGQALYTVADLSTVWVDVQLRESDAGNVRAGSTAALEFAAYPGRPFTGRVAYVYPTLQEQSRTLRARVVVANPAGLLKPGMYATVRLATPAGRRALTVPTSAVIRTGERNVVFVDMGGGSLMPHDVEVGRAAGDDTEVLAGLEPGQRVVTSAQFLLESESNLGEVMQGMAGMSAGRGGSDMPGMTMPGMDMPGTSGTDRGADMRGMPGMPGMPGTPAPAMPPARGGRRP